MTTISNFRSVVCAVFLGLAISAGTVIAFFQIGIGTETAIFASLRDEAFTERNSATAKRDSGAADLTLYDNTNRFFGSRDSGVKRSQGMFRHPAIPASLCGLILPVVLAYLAVARTNRDRILLLAVFVSGIAALVLTFSRAGAIGLAVGMVVCFAGAGWSGLISRRVLRLGIIALVMIVIVSMPLLLTYFQTRPGSFLMRFYLFEAALQGYSQHPFLGVGLNNGTAAMKAGRNALKEIGIPMPPTESADNFYLILLTEVGPLGFFLFFLFFGRIVRFALLAVKKAKAELKPLLIGIVAGLASLATQTLADNPLAGHAVGTTLWLFAGVMLAGARYVQAEAQSSAADWHTAAVDLSSATRL